MGMLQGLIRKLFLMLGWLFFGCVVFQVFLAGAAVFVDFHFWDDHTRFIHFFEFIPVIMLVLSLFGNIPTYLRWQSFGLFLLIILQYVTINMSNQLPYIKALHPVFAMVLFWLALKTGLNAIRLWKKS